MRVTLIAHTTVDLMAALGAGYHVHQTEPATHADELAEFAGRLVTGTWMCPRDESNEIYLGDQLDTSLGVFEHASATFYVTGTTRPFTHELLSEHRNLVLSEVSQLTGPGVDHAFPVVDRALGERDPADELRESFEDSLDEYEDLYQRLRAQHSEQTAREAARGLLPNMASTPFLVSGTVRDWRDVVIYGQSDGATVEAQDFAELVLTALREVAPNSVQDLEDL